MGNIQIVLHAHLPFIRHPEHESFLEETWLFEAISESYTPLLRMMDRLDAEGIRPGLTLSMSPSLNAMLKDTLLQERYIEYLESRIALGEKEVKRTFPHRQYVSLAAMYLSMFRKNLDFFTNTLHRDILAGFSHHQKKGNIEIITTPGTSPFLPFYEQYPSNIHAHIESAIESYRIIFGQDVHGVWMPGGGYYSGVEEIFRKHGLKFFYVDAHGLLCAEGCPQSGIHAPVKTPEGLAVFARDPVLVDKVWSEIDGYPGEFAYRDFYRDIGHDLKFEYIRPYIHSEEFRMNTGYKYYAITGETDQKRPYKPRQARIKLKEHANHFVHTVTQRLEAVSNTVDGEPLVTTPFAAELFGHWWFEGVQWLEAVIRNITQKKSGLNLITPSNYLDENTVQHTLQPVFSSWGNKGYAEVLLNGQNDWIYRHLHSSIERMQELVQRFPDVVGLNRRALNQAAREILLAQTMDWAFIMRSGVSEEYARGPHS